ATEHAVELGESGRGARHCVHLDLGQRARLRGGAAWSPAGARGERATPLARGALGGRFGGGVPGATRRTAPEPARLLVAARRTQEPRLGRLAHRCSIAEAGGAGVRTRRT